MVDDSSTVPDAITREVDTDGLVLRWNTTPVAQESVGRRRIDPDVSNIVSNARRRTVADIAKHAP